MTYKNMSSTATPAASAQAALAKARYKTMISSGRHTITADEPADMQGGDTGMAPLALLLASLGSCTAITLRMYIDRKMWTVDEIIIDLAAYRTESGLSVNCTLNFKGELTSDQKQRLEHIAGACPIHKILTAGIAINTKTA